MRLAFVFPVAMLALATVPVLAAGSLTHDECGASDQTALPNSAVKVEIWRSECTGAVVWAPAVVQCTENGDHHVANLHVLVIHDDGCQTGVLIGPQ